ncbi:trypsin-like cysteine/serine peptidase domain-containing protein [Penicillium maclennaniae]|uniref:trypsin-like cysteine/serine peptidase domain-containing protein n=1 Tax=Penicillium maclennaniae TaxID=1343394 RepID=UPI002540AFBC|nr:trypsin-like cysteine/serine peptidase domain-containing protein [Penicillium maclennaniae]KAJ5674517.1 trypsin-like cysteine/serine peptidase domain-containing protein [Penicillium maclennaniae]
MKLIKAPGNLLCSILMVAHSASAIVGGSDASAGDAPFTVAIISSGFFGDTYICAGSLISSKSVLTTAGCVDGSSASSLKVRIGSLDHIAVTDIKPAGIAEKAALTGAPIKLYGWGSTAKLLDAKPRALQRLDTTFISADDCETAWSDDNPVTSNMNCDAAPEKNQGSCNGDQGGPVVNESGELVGIMGYYDYCEPHSNGRPDVNNDPVAAVDWIDLNTI